jgi:tRNA-splicing endonuclease subunit Sen34
LNTLEFRVYHDLWRRGKFLTTGETFGGHFLVYPGDPLHFHASHIVHVVHAPLTVQQLVSYGRVSVIVNKACVFASESPGGDIVYQHMEWENEKNELMGV